MKLTCYTYGTDLMAYDSAERIRRATRAEIRESDQSGDTGAFVTEVSERTVRARCPILMRAKVEVLP